MKLSERLEFAAGQGKNNVLELCFHQICREKETKIFNGELAVRMSVSLTLMPALGALFLLVSCHVQHQYDSFRFILFYFIFSCLFVMS